MKLARSTYYYRSRGPTATKNAVEKQRFKASSANLIFVDVSRRRSESAVAISRGKSLQDAALTAGRGKYVTRRRV
jgi:hypothetical protein